jgi:hypothetical protein
VWPLEVATQQQAILATSPNVAIKGEVDEAVRSEERSGSDRRGMDVRVGERPGE